MNKLLACTLILCFLQAATCQYMCKLPCNVLIDSCVTNYHVYDVFVCKALCNENLATCIQKKQLKASSFGDYGCEKLCDMSYNNCKGNCVSSQLCIGICQAAKDDCYSRC